MLPIIGLNYLNVGENNIIFMCVELTSLMLYILLVKISKFDFQRFIEMVSVSILRFFLLLLM